MIPNKSMVFVDFCEASKSRKQFYIATLL